MSDEPVLTSSWCTNWGAFNTPRLWSMVMNEDEGPGRQQVSAWRTLAGSVRSQRTALLAARAELVAAWPPEDNESSAAFVQELDILIARLDTASSDADSTASGLDNILTAIQKAKTQIQPLWEEYKDKSDDLVPRWWDNAEDEIDEKARQAMISAERAVSDSVPLLKVPEKYELTIKDKIDELGGGEDGAKSTATRRVSSSSGISATVPHEPVPPVPGQDATIPDAGQLGSDSGTSGADVGGNVGAGAGVGGGGPDLAGVITPGHTPALPGGDVVGLPGGGGAIPTPPPSGGGGLPINPAVPGLLPIGGSAPISPGGRVGRGGTVRPSTRPGLSGPITGEQSTGGVGRPGVLPLGTTGGRTGNSGRTSRVRGVGGGVTEAEGAGGRSPRGGVGGMPSAGLGAVGGAGRGATSGRRAGRVPRPSWLPDDPVGRDRHTGPGASMAGGFPDRGTRRGHSDDAVDFDPDNPWEVAEGVDPVISPAPDEARHDPGPNVIGWR